MEYWKIEFEGEQILVESDLSSKTVYKQMVIDETIHLSAFEDCLAEGDFYIDDMEGQIEQISKSEFEAIWYSELHKYEQEWQKIKRKYAIGSVLEVKTQYSYPWGWIVSMEDSIVIKGLMDSKRSHYSNDVIKCIVSGYDEQNLWVLMNAVE